MDNFNRMLQALRDKNFLATFYSSVDGYCYVIAKDKDTVAIFAENDSKAPDYIRGRITFDNKRALCKWSKCPYHLPLPKNKKDLKYIFDKMEYLKTKEGFKKSVNCELNEWEYK